MITLYSTGCPKCKVLKGKLKDAGVEYTEINDVDTMIGLGLDEVPVLNVDGQMLSFSAANNWIKSGCIRHEHSD